MIRMAQREDVPAMLEIYRPYILETAYTFEYTVPSLAEFTHRFDTIHARFPWLVWEENGEILVRSFTEGQLWLFFAAVLLVIALLYLANVLLWTRRRSAV